MLSWIDNNFLCKSMSFTLDPNKINSRCKFTNRYLQGFMTSSVTVKVNLLSLRIQDSYLLYVRIQFTDIHCHEIFCRIWKYSDPVS